MILDARVEAEERGGEEEDARGVPGGEVVSCSRTRREEVAGVSSLGCKLMRRGRRGQKIEPLVDVYRRKSFSREGGSE
jgi:hypothetical protein